MRSDQIRAVTIPILQVKALLYTYQALESTQGVWIQVTEYIYRNRRSLWQFRKFWKCLCRVGGFPLSSQPSTAANVRLSS
jgi:hypothetical protein